MTLQSLQDMIAFLDSLSSSGLVLWYESDNRWYYRWGVHSPHSLGGFDSLGQAIAHAVASKLT